LLEPAIPTAIIKLRIYWVIEDERMVVLLDLTWAG
jgi:hypothetical protein